MSFGPVKACAERLRESLAQQHVQATLEPVDEDSTITVLRDDGSVVLRGRYEGISSEAVLAKLRDKT